VSTSSACALALALVLGVSAPAFAGDVRGRVSLGVQGVSLDDTGPVVVYLESAGAPLHFALPAHPLEIHQKDASFTPSFLVIAAGETVVMPNDDVIFHNVFSYSTPNDFDLGLYPRGDSRAKTFQYPGVVRIYCSIHESMNATIFVAPSIWHAVAGAHGEFAIRDVPPGKYRLRTWNRRLPPVSELIEVDGGKAVTANLVVASGGGP
jgi:plastocyanin